MSFEGNGARSNPGTAWSAPGIPSRLECGSALQACRKEKCFEEKNSDQTDPYILLGIRLGAEVQGHAHRQDLAQLPLPPMSSLYVSYRWKHELHVSVMWILTMNYTGCPTQHSACSVLDYRGLLP